MKGVNKKTGKRLSGLEHIKQSIEDILSTPLKQRVMLPEYGSELPDIIDNPEGSETTIRIYSSAYKALDRWEPRITLYKMLITRVKEGHIEMSLYGTVTETGEKVNIEGVTVYGRK